MASAMTLRAIDVLGAERSAVTAVASDEEIRRRAAEVLGRDEYRLDRAIDPEAIGIWLRILEWVLQPIAWLFDALSGLPDAIRWLIVVVLMVTLVLLVAHLAWSFVAAIRGVPLRRRANDGVKDPQVTPEQFEQVAGDAAAAGDYITAARVLFQASLLRIERAEAKKLRRGITNRELLRRYRGSPLAEPLGRLIDTIEAKWYGYETCYASDYERCHHDYAQIISLIRGAKSDAVGT